MFLLVPTKTTLCASGVLKWTGIKRGGRGRERGREERGEGGKPLILFFRLATTFTKSATNLAKCHFDETVNTASKELNRYSEVLMNAVESARKTHEEGPPPPPLKKQPLIAIVLSELTALLEAVKKYRN